MCGRVRLSSDYSEIKIALKFDLDAPAPNFEADWNKPPTAEALLYGVLLLQKKIRRTATIER